MPNRRGHAAPRLISAAGAALKLGVDVATLQRWNIYGRGPAAVSGLDCAALAYRASELEAWQDRLGADPATAPALHYA